MPAMKKADLIGAMEALGETPPKSWTVTEIECRLQELRKEKGIPEMAQRKNKTPLRQMMVDLNTAGRKKENLIKHMQEVLHVPLTGTETIKVMMAKGVQAVYDQAEASPQDPVGFGKHSSLSYEEVYQKHVTYCTWVTTPRRGQRLLPMPGETGQLVGGTSTSRPEPSQPGIGNTCQGSSLIRATTGLQADNQRAHDRDLGHILHLRRQETRIRPGDQGAPSDAGPIRDHPEGGSPGSQDGTASQRGQGEEPSGTVGCRQLRAAAAMSVDPSAALRTLDSPADRLGQSTLGLEGNPSEVKKVTPGVSRSLKQDTERMATEAFQSLVLQDRVVLLEVACSQDSILTKTMQTMTGQEKSARRLSIWNHFDLSTNNGVRSILDIIDVEKPNHVWISTECGPYSIMQNVNQRNPDQCAALESKRKEVLKQYVRGMIVYVYCIQKGIHATWEWSQSCQAWRLPLLQQVVRKYQVYFSIVRGCQVGLKDKKGNPVSKGWKLMTTHELLAQRMHLPCSCGKDTRHVPCEGHLTKQSAYYTSPFAKRVCSTILQGVTDTQLKRDLQGHFMEGDLFGKGTFCVCEEHRKA